MVFICLDILLVRVSFCFFLNLAFCTIASLKVCLVTLGLVACVVCMFSLVV